MLVGGFSLGLWGTHAHTCRHTHAHVRTQTHKHTRAHTQTHTHTDTGTVTRMHTQAHDRPTTLPCCEKPGVDASVSFYFGRLRFFKGAPPAPRGRGQDVHRESQRRSCCPSKVPGGGCPGGHDGASDTRANPAEPFRLRAETQSSFAPEKTNLNVRMCACACVCVCASVRASVSGPGLPGVPPGPGGGLGGPGGATHFLGL